jgi:nucleotide-binding universal stress UspA family protein
MAMTRILAAIDASPAAGPVLQVARLFGDLLAASPEAIEVESRASVSVREIAEYAGVPLRVLPGVAEQVILREAAADDVALTVIGARGLPSGRHPAGHVALHVIQKSKKPVVVVPPSVCAPKLDRVLIPLDGSHATGLAVAAVAGHLARAGAELVVVHTFTPETTPTMLNHGGALDVWGAEFLMRSCPELADARLELRVGAPGTNVIELARDEQADLVVLAWSRDLSAGHGQIVLEAVAQTTVPTLLLPLDAERDPFQPTRFTDTRAG